MEGKRAAELAEKRLVWQGRLAEWKEGGLTQTEYCRRNNLDPKNFLYWKKKILPRAVNLPLVELPSEIVARSSRPANPQLCLLIDSRYRLEIPPGFDDETLVRLIRLLDRQ
ncbi:MAG: hypothetical protein QG555_1352 [Thermodesulfobacteriota bacterium]|nr:hypothetical protein [Thermodesulfobacteriota bacterium]